MKHTNTLEKYTTSLQASLLEVHSVIQKSLDKHVLPRICKIGSTFLTKMFPFEDFDERPSVFIQQTWIEKVMNKSQVKDYLWHPTKVE